jgi:hypothetical protein
MTARTLGYVVCLLLVSGTGAAADPVPTGDWMNIGPKEISDVYGLASGRISDVVVEDSGVILIAAANGGLWRQDPKTTTWTPVGENLSSLSFGALDRSGSTYYAASGERHWCADCNPGNGIFKSVDDGRTWQRFSNSPVKFASAIRVSPRDGRTIWLAGDTGLFIYAKDSGGSWMWQPIYSADGVAFHNPTSIVIDPTNPDHIFVADDQGVVEREQAGGLWTRLNIPVAPDAVKAWSPTRFTAAIAVAPSNPRIMYASFAYAAWSTNYKSGCLAGMFKSTNSGRRWDPLPVPDYFEDTFAFGTGEGLCQGTYDNALAVDPTDENDVYAGGITLIRSRRGGIDGWLRVGSMLDGEPDRNLHPDQHAIAFDHAGNAYVANDGGLLRVAKNGDIKNLSRGLMITQFDQGGALSSDDVIMLAGTQDNGNDRVKVSFPLHPQGASRWRAVLSGDGGFTAIDQADFQREYVEYIYGDLRGTVNGDADEISWEKIGPGAKHASFFMPFVVDPQNWQTIFTGADNIYKTTSGGHWGRTNDGLLNPSTSWEKLTDWTNNTANVVALAVADKGQTIIAGRDDGVIYISAKGGNSDTWSSYDVGGTITSILIDPTNSKQAYIACRSGDDFRVWRATWLATGPAWFNLSAGLPPVNALRSYRGHILAGSDHGVYELDQNTWKLVGHGLPAVPVVDILEMHDGTLVVLTHGRGSWALIGKR